MILTSVIDSLMELKLLDEYQKIQITVSEGYSPARKFEKEDELFKCYLPAREAKRFFGGLEVITNKLVKQATKDEMIEELTFQFLLDASRKI